MFLEHTHRVTHNTSLGFRTIFYVSKQKFRIKLLWSAKFNWPLSWNHLIQASVFPTDLSSQISWISQSYDNDRKHFHHRNINHNFDIMKMTESLWTVFTEWSHCQRWSSKKPHITILRNKWNSLNWDPLKPTVILERASARARTQQ